MKKSLVLIMLLFSACIVFADITVKQKLQTSGMMGKPPVNGVLTMSIKGSKARIGTTDSATYQILDLKSNKMSIVDPTKKQVMVMSSQMMDAASQMMGAMGKDMKTDVHKTGKSDVVNGFKCDEYIVNTTGGMFSMNSTQCVTKDVDYSEFEPFRQYAESWVKMAGSAWKAQTELRGIPVRMEAKMTMMGQTIESKTEVTSISHDSISDAMFKVPADYKVLEMPKLPQKPQQ